MKQYICSICGYIYDETKEGLWGNLPENWKCPWCGAGKDAFQGKTDVVSVNDTSLEKLDVEKEFSVMEMSIICSNLAKGCEKQYMPNQAEMFKILGDFFKSEATALENPSGQTLLNIIEKELSIGYPYGKIIASENADRGALRCQAWSEKVTRMLQSLLNRYEKEGNKMLDNTGVYVCTVCGFIYIGDSAPETCPVCKVPGWKFEKIEGRE